VDETNKEEDGKIDGTNNEEDTYEGGEKIKEENN
jgi:hypothetical protein